MTRPSHYIFLYCVINATTALQQKWFEAQSATHRRHRGNTSAVSEWFMDGEEGRFDESSLTHLQTKRF